MANQQQTDGQDLRRLSAFFAPDDLDWRAITISKRTNKGLAAAYITNRAIMNRLDEAVGPENWRNEFEPGPGGGIVCGLSIFVESRSEWVTKWDGAENTDVEAIKGGLSNAMRRAAVQWGIGRYLYDFPQQWVPVDDYKQFKIPPRVPREFLPGHETPDTRQRRTVEVASDHAHDPEETVSASDAEPRQRARSATPLADASQAKSAALSKLGIGAEDFEHVVRMARSADETIANISAIPENLFEAMIGGLNRVANMLDGKVGASMTGFLRSPFCDPWPVGQVKLAAALNEYLGAARGGDT